MKYNRSHHHRFILLILTLTATATLLIASTDVGSMLKKPSPTRPNDIAASLTTNTALDTTPPTINPTIAFPILWSPNKEMVDVGLKIMVADDSAENPVVNVRVYSNEADQSLSDPPADALPMHSFRGDRLPLQLRAQREDEGNGRVYLIVIRASDRSGNMSFACRTVVVPHNQSSKSAKTIDQLATKTLATCGALGSPLAPFKVGDPTNSSPQANSDTNTTDEDVVLNVAPLGSLLNDVDAEGEPLSASLVSGPSHGSLTFNSNGSFIYTPLLNFYGVDSFTYKARDDERESAVTTVSLTINPVNDAPVAERNAYSVTQNTSLVVNSPGLLANDSDVENSPLTATPFANPAHGSLSLAVDGSLSYTPHADFVGTDSFSYRANDGELDSAPVAVTLTVRPADSSFGNAEVLDTVEMDQGSHIQRTQLLRSEFKYPFILIKENLTRDAGGAETFVLPSLAMVADHVTVRVRNGITREQLETALQSFGFSIRKDMMAPDTYLVTTGQPTLNGLDEAISILLVQNIVAYAEPDYIFRLASVFPTDPDLNKLWGLHNVGQLIGQSGFGKPDADIDAPEAWQLTTGSHAVKVAIIDSGMDYNHPELNPNVWSNPGETINGVDDDHNGFIDDQLGWDFYSNDNDAIDMAQLSHGTHVAGTIGASANNSRGIVGVNWNVSMVPIRVFGPDGASSADLADAIRYATLVRADLSSNSWSGRARVQVIKEAIEDANAHGILFVAAAGNGPIFHDNDQVPSYPSGFDIPNIISVAATDNDDNLPQFSNFGATTVDLAAPGVDIYSTFPFQNFGFFSGTSMATPHVSGVCALVKAYAPHLTHLQIRNLILAKVDPVPSLTGKCVTGGRLNAFRTLLAVTPRPQIVTFHMDDPAGPNGGYYRIGLLDQSGNVPGWGEVTRIPGHWGDAADDGGMTNVDINGNGMPDLIAMHVDDPAGPNIGWYKIGWDFEPSGNVTGGWTAVKNIPGHWGDVGDGADIAAADLNNNGRPDLVAFHIDDPAGANIGWYKIGWDLNQSGDVTGGWDPVKQIPGHWGDRDGGGGFAIADLNGNGRPEFVTFHIDDPAGANIGWYRIGWDVDTSGNVTGNWTEVRNIPGHWGDATEGGGIVIDDVNNNGRPDFIVLHVDDPAGANFGFYRIGWDVDTAGHVTGGWTPATPIPGHWGDAVDGAGVTIVRF